MIFAKEKASETKEKSPKTVSNRFMDFIENNKYIGRNPIKRFVANWKFNKFCKKIMGQSPSLGVLWFFADFIKISERVYFFPNRQTGELYSSRSYSIGENGFIINDEAHSIKLNIKLNSDLQRTIIEINRNGGTQATTELTFMNNSWGDDIQPYDEVLVDNVIGLINSYIVGLLRFCWNAKGSYDDIHKIINQK